MVFRVRRNLGAKRQGDQIALLLPIGYQARGEVSLHRAEGFRANRGRRCLPAGNAPMRIGERLYMF